MTANTETFFANSAALRRTAKSKLAPQIAWPVVRVYSSGKPISRRSRQTISSLPVESTEADAVATRYRGLHLLGDTRQGGPQQPNSGDLLYWIGCLAAACLLLLTTT